MSLVNGLPVQVRFVVQREWACGLVARAGITARSLYNLCVHVSSFFLTLNSIFFKGNCIC